MNTKGRQLWIDNIKLIACVAVFWRHFYSSFYGQLKDTSWLNDSDICVVFVMQHILNILFNGGWWVFVFCLISGWLAWRKNINTIEDLAKALLHRYIRFVLPVLIANCFVVVIGKTIGFHAFEVGTTIGNEWLAGNYTSTPQANHILKSALLLNNEYVGPLWVLLYIFVGTCAIYCLKYLSYKCHLDNTSACLGILAIWPVAYYTLCRYGSSWFYAVVVVEGALLSLAGNMADHEITHKELMPIIGIVIIAAALNVWSLDSLWNCITAMLFLSWIPANPHYGFGNHEIAIVVPGEPIVA